MQINAQIVTIGSGNSSYGNAPIVFSYGYTYSQSIYLSNEISQPSGSNIYRIKYKGATTLENTDNWTVYLANTTKTSFDSKTDWVALADLTQVFTGTVSLNADNTIIIEFSSPFTYTGGNLLIAVDENTAGYTFGSDLYTSSVSSNRSIYYRQDNTNPNPGSSFVATGTESYIPNIDIDFNSVGCNEIVTNLGVSDLTDTSVNLTWTAGGSVSNWNVEYGVSGFTQGSGTTVNTSVNSSSISGLTSNTSYDFYVQTNCGSGITSDWVGPFTFATDCSTFTAPYTQNFDGTSTPNIDACWKTDIIGATGNPSIKTYSQYKFSSPNSLCLNANYDNTGDYYIISPKFSDLDNSKRVKIQIRRDLSSEFTSTLEIGTMTDKNDINTYTTFQSINLADLPEDAWQEVIISLSSLNISADHIVFKYKQGTTNSDWNNRLYFDDFVYEEIPGCLKPTDLSVSNITGEVSVDLAWTANSGETEWDIEYGETGFTQGSGTTITVTENPYTLSNIAENTTFDFYVKANCSVEESSWSNKGVFTTSDKTVANEGAVGINTEVPRTTLDVHGPIMATSRNDEMVYYECNQEIEGAFGYDKSTGELKVCTKNSNSEKYEWKALRYGNN